MVYNCVVLGVCVFVGVYSSEELVVLESQLEAERARNSGSQTTVTVVSPPRLSEAEM